MKDTIRKYVSLTVMLLLLGLVISLLPMEGTLETTYGVREGANEPVKVVHTVSLSTKGLHE